MMIKPYDSHDQLKLEFQTGESIPIKNYSPPITTAQFGTIISRELDVKKIADFITPLEQFFVRNHFKCPSDTSPDSWKLSLSGLFEAPCVLDMDDILGFEHVTKTIFIECTGNSHSTTKDIKKHMTFEKLLRLADPAQWKSIAGFLRGGNRHGLISNGIFTGVRLFNIFRQHPLSDQAKFIVFRGQDKGYDNLAHRLKREQHHYERSFEIEELKKFDPLLCFMMNGQKISPDRGGPLRLVIPGVYGAEHVKWLGAIVATPSKFKGYFMENYYANPVDIEKDGNVVREMKPVHEQHPKAITVKILSKPDGIHIIGVAWGGISPISKVQVNFGDNEEWRDADLLCQQIDHSWVFWRYILSPKPCGTVTVSPRAFAGNGDAQPFKYPDHLLYGNNGVIPVTFEIL